MKNTVVDLINFVDQIYLHFSKNINGVRKPPKIKNGFPGIENLILSFSGAFVESHPKDMRRRSDWNPLSQQIMLYRRDFDASRLEWDFTELQTACALTLGLIHEMLHVVLWEPFFTGKIKIESFEQYFKLALSFEAFCFWHTDIIATPNLRALAPDGEFVYGRTTISTKNFYPLRALRAVGLKNKEEILKIYVNAFLGANTKLDRLQSPHIKNITLRIFDFYNRSISPHRKIYQIFKDSQIFDQFYFRFCQVENIPQLFENSYLEKNTYSNMIPYFVDIWKKRLPQIMLAPNKSNLLRVQLRRSIQTRAYFTYQIIQAFKNEQVFSLNRKIKNHDSRDHLKNLESYLKMLEVIINQLSIRSLPELRRLISKSDRYYHLNLRMKFSHQQLWMSRRKFIFPELKTESNFFGLLPTNVKIRKKQAHVLLNWINREIIFFKTNNSLMNAAGNGRTGAKSFLKLVDQSNLKSSTQFVKNSKIWIKTYNQFLVCAEILPNWSVQLSEINPAKNDFREICFEFV